MCACVCGGGVENDYITEGCDDEGGVWLYESHSPGKNSHRSFVCVFHLK